jgi:hypothetical protein
MPNHPLPLLWERRASDTDTQTSLFFPKEEGMREMIRAVFGSTMDKNNVFG